MNIKLPEGFNLLINLKHAIGNAAGVALFLALLGITKPLLIIAGVVFGFFGGSVNDIIGWRRNKDAINAAAEETKNEEGK